MSSKDRIEISAYQRTGEQADIVNAARNRGVRENIIVEAGAGTGKTTIIKDICQYLHDDGQKVAYLVFNKHNAIEAKQRLNGIARVNTINAMAYHGQRSMVAKRSVKNLYPSQIAEYLSLTKAPGGLSREAYCRLVKATLTTFCQSADMDVAYHHLMTSKEANTSINDIAKEIIRDTEIIFNYLRPVKDVNTEHRPITHDIILKSWHLDGSPGIERYDLVAVDEAQDSNEVSLAIYNRAKSLLMVGDECQAIFRWRGGCSALEKTEGRRFPLSQSFRFGPDVAELANAIIARKNGYKGIAKLKGLSSINTNITKVAPGQIHTRIYRTNQDLVFSGRYLADNGLPTNMYGDMSDLKMRLESAWALKSKSGRRYIKHPIIALYKTWDDFCCAVQDMPDPEMTQTVKIVEEQDKRTPDVIQLLDDQAKKKDKSDAKVTLVSGHRSKGSEWNDVVIEKDFDRKFEKRLANDVWDDEMNLLYVAVTRAQRCLELRPKFLTNLYNTHVR